MPSTADPEHIQRIKTCIKRAEALPTCGESCGSANEDELLLVDPLVVVVLLPSVVLPSLLLLLPPLLWSPIAWPSEMTENCEVPRADRDREVP